MKDIINDMMINDMEDSMTALKKSAIKELEISLKKQKQELVNQKNELKTFVLNVWKMQNPDFDLVEKFFDISGFTWTDIYYKGARIDTIEKPISKISAEDMSCLLEKRDYMLRQFPYSRIDKLLEQESLSKEEEKELQTYSKFITNYNFWKNSKDVFVNAMESFDKIVNVNKSKLAIEHRLNMEMNSYYRNTSSSQYEKFLQDNSSIKVVNIKQNKDGKVVYNRKLYINDKYIRSTTESEEINITFNDLMYLYNECLGVMKSYENSAYIIQRKKLLKQNRESSANVIKVIKNKMKIKKLDERYESLRNSYKFWKDNQQTISNAIVSYFDMFNAYGNMKMIDEEIEGVDKKIEFTARAMEL